MALNFAATADNTNFIDSVEQITSGVEQATSRIEEYGLSLEDFFDRIKNISSNLANGFEFKDIVSQIINTRAEFQKLETAFTTFLGSEEAAGKLMQQITHTAAIAPFDLTEVAEGARTLLAFGVAAEDVNKTIVSLGDIAGGLSKPLGDIISLYASAISKPSVETSDIEQIMSNGIPVVKELARQFDVAESAVLDLVSAGEVSSDSIKKAFESMTAEGSMFGGFMEAQSETISGKIVGIQSAVDAMFNEIGSSADGIVNLTLDATNTIIQNWESVLLILADVAAAYGTQKAFLTLNTGFNKAVTNYAYDAEIEQLKSLVPVKEDEAKSSIEQAVASGKLSEAKAAEILALREQANAQLDILKEAEEIAKKEAKLTAEAIKAHDLKTLALEDEKQTWLDLYDEAINAGDAESAQAIATEIAATEVGLKESADVALTLAEEARAAATNVVTASEARETLETQINTAQTTGNTAATGILTIAKEKLAAAVLRVNTALASNSFAVVTALVLAFGYAVYKLISYKNEAAKASEEAAKYSAEHDASMRRELSTLDEMKNRLEKAKKGTDEWKNAKEDIVAQFGGYSSTLDTEIEKTGSLASSYKELTQAIRLSAAAKAIGKFRAKHDNFDDISNGLQLLSERLEDVYLLDSKGNRRKDENGNFIKGRVTGALKEGLQQKAYDYMSGKDVQFSTREKEYLKQTYFFKINAGGPVGYIDGFGLSRRKKSIAEIKGAESIAQSYGTTLDKVDSIDKKEGTEISENSRTYWEREVKKRKEKYENTKKEDKEGSEKALKSLKEAEAKLAEYNTYITSNQKSTSYSNTSQVPEKEKYITRVSDLIREQQEERLKLQLEYEYQLAQNRIDLMEEGEAKVLAQMRLDNARELSALEEQRRQAVKAEKARQKALFDAKEDQKAAEDQNYKKKPFDQEKDFSALEIEKIESNYSKLKDQLLLKQKKAEEELREQAKESMNAYLKEFGTYQEKRDAMEEEYGNKISHAKNEGERMQFTAQRNRSLADLDYEEWFGTGTMALAFGDISKLSEKTVEGLISDMESYRKIVVDTFDPDKIEQYEEALAGLKKVRNDKSFGIISSAVPDYFMERKNVGEKMASAAQSINTLSVPHKDLLLQSNQLRRSIDLNKSMGVDTSGLEVQLRETEVQLKANEEAIRKTTIAFTLLEEEWKRLETPEAKFEGLCAAISSVSELTAPLVSGAADMCEALGADGMGEALGYLGDAMGSVSNIASGFSKGGVIGGIAAAAGELMNWIGKISTAGDNRHRKRIEDLQEQIDALDRSYERLGKAVGDAYSTDAGTLLDEQNTLLEQQRTLIEQQIAEEEAKKKSDDDVIQGYRDRLEEIDDAIADNRRSAKEAIIGEDLKSAIDEFAGLYAEAWSSGRDAAEKSVGAVRNIISSALSEMLKGKIEPASEAFYDRLAEAMEDGLLEERELEELDAIKREIDAIAEAEAEQFGMIEARYRNLDELREELTDISFDSVRDNFKSLLSDMESTTADFTDSFSDMLRNALIEGLMGSKYDRLLDEWYREFASAMENGELSDLEREALRQRYDSIVQQGIADRDAINSIVGGGAYSQSATSGGWASMGQETAEELNGRFTALTELNVINNTLVAEGNTIAARILETLNGFTSLSMVTEGNNPALSEIRDMMFLSTGHLEEISKYTRQLITIREGIDHLNDTINQRL